jgi:hypothetical protein
MKFGFKCFSVILVALFLLEITPAAAQSGFAKVFRLASDKEEKSEDAESPTAIATDYDVTPASFSTACNDKNCNCDSGCSVRPLCRPYSESCPRVGLYTYAGFESWRGVSDGLTNNNGAFAGANMGIPIPKLKDYGFGLQLGATYGVYDWMGRATNGMDEANQSQQQLFVTSGVFHRADENCGWSGGFVHDWMINDNFGTLSMEPSLGQWRAQVGYALSGKNEVGVWAAWRNYGRTQDYFTSELPITYEPIGQVNLFWHHKISTDGADTWLWLGVPTQTRINRAFAGVLNDVTFGAAVQAPMSDSLALAGNFQYAKAAASQGVLGSLEDSFDLSLSLVFYPGRCAKSQTVAGRSWMPLLPVANNGSFMVDRNL